MDDPLVSNTGKQFWVLQWSLKRLNIFQWPKISMKYLKVDQSTGEEFGSLQQGRTSGPSHPRRSVDNNGPSLPTEGAQMFPIMLDVPGGNQIQDVISAISNAPIKDIS